MKPVNAALLFAVILLITNIAIDRMAGDESRPFLPLLVGAAVGGAVFGLVIHLWDRRKSAG